MGSKRCKRVDEDQLEAGFYAKCRAGRCWPDRTVSRQSSADALVKLFNDHLFPFRGPHIRRTASRPPSTGRFSNRNSNHENTLVVDVDDQSTVGREEGKTQQTRPMAHTESSLYE